MLKEHLRSTYLSSPSISLSATPEKQTAEDEAGFQHVKQNHIPSFFMEAPPPNVHKRTDRHSLRQSTTLLRLKKKNNEKTKKLKMHVDATKTELLRACGRTQGNKTALKMHMDTRSLVSGPYHYASGSP